VGGSFDGIHELTATGAWSAVTTTHGLITNTVEALALDTGGGLWVGTPLGLQRRGADGTRRTVEPEGGLPDPRVHDMAIQHRAGDEDVVWVATAGGVARLDPSGALQRWWPAAEVFGTEGVVAEIAVSPGGHA
jgi:ligand-binding sensor domain-containing protein